jgi:hypothetical protein
VPLPDTLVIYPHISNHLNSLEPSARTIEINKLLLLSISKCQREDNIHRNKLFLLSVNMPPLFTGRAAGNRGEAGSEGA